MQRLKQHNLGARLRLEAADLLIAQGPALPHRSTLRRVRSRVELGGYAERSYHEVARGFSIFSHRSVELDGARLAAITEAWRIAWSERPGEAMEDDPDEVYRTVEFRDGGEVRRLYVAYEAGVARPAASAFETAWALLERQFLLADHPDA